MALTLKSFPDWTPEILRTLYLSRQEEARANSTDPLLERLVSDPRMKSAWKAITKRNKDQEYPLSIFLFLALMTSCPEPIESLNALKQRYNRIADQAKFLMEEMKGSLLDKEGALPIVSAIARSADELASGVDSAFFPYVNSMERDVKFPMRTMLARRIHKRFINDFGMPLWATVASIVEVVCDVPPGEIDSNWVRGSVNSAVKSI